MRAGAAGLGRAVVHHVHELLPAAADMTREHIRRLVRGGEHERVQQVTHGHLLTEQNAGVRAVRRDVFEIDCLGGHGFVQIGHVFERQQGGHDFCGRGRIALLVGVLRIEHHAAVRADEQSRRCVERG